MRTPRRWAWKMQLELPPRGDEVLFRATGRRPSLRALPSGHLAIDMMDFNRRRLAHLPGQTGRAEGPQSRNKEYMVCRDPADSAVGHVCTWTESCGDRYVNRPKRRRVTFAAGSDAYVTEAGSDQMLPVRPFAPAACDGVGLVPPGAEPRAPVVDAGRDEPTGSGLAAAVLRRWIRLLKQTIYVTMAGFHQYMSVELLRLSMDDRQLKDISTAETQQRPPRPPLGAAVELVRSRPPQTRQQDEGVPREHAGAVRPPGVSDVARRQQARGLGDVSEIPRAVGARACAEATSSTQR